MASRGKKRHRFHWLTLYILKYTELLKACVMFRLALLRSCTLSLCFSFSAFSLPAVQLNSESLKSTRYDVYRYRWCIQRSLPTPITVVSSSVTSLSPTQVCHVTDLMSLITRCSFSDIRHLVISNTWPWMTCSVVLGRDHSLWSSKFFCFNFRDRIDNYNGKHCRSVAEFV